jgi:hypothetical protein
MDTYYGTMILDQRDMLAGNHHQLHNLFWKLQCRATPSVISTWTNHPDGRVNVKTSTIVKTSTSTCMKQAREHTKPVPGTNPLSASVILSNDVGTDRRDEGFTPHCSVARYGDTKSRGSWRSLVTTTSQSQPSVGHS